MKKKNGKYKLSPSLIKVSWFIPPPHHVITWDYEVTNGEVQKVSSSQTKCSLDEGLAKPDEEIRITTQPELAMGRYCNLQH